jgi:hypothetical protein
MVAACKSPNRNCSELSRDELILNVKVVEYTAVGYGEVYNCAVEQPCPEWDIADTIRLTIMHDDTSRIVEKGWESRATLNIAFVAGEEDVPYRIMPINGFVDENNNTWVISQIKILD